MSTKKLTCIDIFCGAGGFSEGFSQAGFSILAAVDHEEHATATLRESHPGTELFHDDIRKLKPRALLSRLGLKQGELDCLIGGPPCQAFSINNHQRGMHDQRSGLLKDYLRMVEGLRPKFIVMENVTGILSVGEGEAVRRLYLRLQKLGYQVGHQVLKAEEYGVPQERRRVFFAGNRLGLKFEWPHPTHGKSDRTLAPLVTVADAISDLPSLDIQEGDEVQPYSWEPKSHYQESLRNSSTAIYNHVAPYLAPVNRERLKHISQGGSWRDLPRHLLPSGMKRARLCDHTRRYGRLHLKGLAFTILTKCDVHWGTYIHPTQERTITVREAARLQSFPDHIRFVGPRMAQFKQVGNAVPPLVAKAIGRSVAEALRHRN